MPLYIFVDTSNMDDLTEADVNDLKESIQSIMKTTLEENPSIYEQYEFDNILRECVYENFNQCIDYDQFFDIYDESFHDNMQAIMLPYRSMLVTFESCDDLNEKIKELVSIPQPEQRTKKNGIFSDRIT